MDESGDRQKYELKKQRKEEMAECVYKKEGTENT
jgi:hypothetical protein